jgi:transcriptional regulator with XRE-family HTH domain
MPRTAASEVIAKLVGTQVRLARTQAGLNQRQLGERLNASGSYIANVEAGRENLTVGQLANIAAALGSGLEISFPVPGRERIDVPTTTA